MRTRKASAEWSGGLKGGKGSFRTETGLGGAYSFVSRFETGQGSNPEELLAAAEAACYSMALSGALEKNGTPATKIATDASCTIEKIDEKQTISKIVLTVKGTVPKIDNATFQRLVEETRVGCPVSRALKAVPIEVNATLA